MGMSAEAMEEEGQEGQPEVKRFAGKKLILFIVLPDLLINLNTGTSAARRTNFLKISVSLELDNPGDIEVVTQNMPRIIDNFQIYLRELRIDDLQGSAGLYRLRE